MVHSIDKASKGIWKCYIGSIPILGVSVVQVHISDLQQTSSTERKAQALVPVCCFVNKAIIRKAGNKYAIRRRNRNKS